MNASDKAGKKLIKYLSNPSFAEASVFPSDPETDALTVLGILRARKEKAVLAVPSYADAAQICHEIRVWSHAVGEMIHPVLIPEGVWKGNPEAEDESPRAEVLEKALRKDSPQLFVGSLPALLAPVPHPEDFMGQEIVLHTGDTAEIAKLAEHLIQLGYDDEAEAVSAGEFSRRGGILDVYSPGMLLPVRIEFFGNEIDSMREYGPADGRSIRKITECRILARSGTALPAEGEAYDDFSAYVPGRYLIIQDPLVCREMMLKYGKDEDPERWKVFQKKIPVRAELLSDLECSNRNLILPHTVFGAAPALRLSAAESRRTAEKLARNLSAEFIRENLNRKMEVCLSAPSASDREHITAFLKENSLDQEKKIFLAEVPFPCGVLIPDQKILLLTERELFSACLRGRAPLEDEEPEEEELLREAEFRRVAEGSTGLADIDEGDCVVHLNYGLCRFLGIRTVDCSAGPVESMELEFADEMKMYVPVTQAHLLTRYVGSHGGGIRLSKPGSRRWLKTREEAGASARNLACEMLRMQAARKASPGVAFPQDTLEQKLFEDSFPYEMTPGQTTSIEEIKGDMEKIRPMDRLLCGDVGYGKTEVAMRAVFKCVSTGKQAAVLVPTTVLAQQHEMSFRERFKEYPLVIETLSRLRTDAEKHDVLQRLSSGGIDILIGTHAILGKEVKFRDLGLLVIDEEQRFGVEHKEKLKAARVNVDVLTMTATPIPRTLHMSMSGLRDLSVIMTPPVKRLPVHTVVMQYDRALVGAALSRELSRGGQVFYLYNRVATIDAAADKVRALAPDARIEIAHGQMKPAVLEEIMGRFMEGKIDILVCTTIIESGIDVPNANTIIVERADTFGLAELHQLRGRVGRWNRQAYAYLLIPPSGVMTTDARQRMTAIRRYTQLGAGFKLAIRDLEIRGAGNIIGAEQSGFVDAIGFHLYCQLLQEAANTMRGVRSAKLPDAELNFDFLEFALKTHPGKIAACIPPEYVQETRLRLDLYRRIALLPDLKELSALEEEIPDKFGPLPQPARNFLTATRLRLMVFACGWKLLSCREGKVFLERNGEVYRRRGMLPHVPLSFTPEQKLRALLDFMTQVQAETGNMKNRRPS